MPDTAERQVMVSVRGRAFAAVAASIVAMSLVACSSSRSASVQDMPGVADSASAQAGETAALLTAEELAGRLASSFGGEWAAGPAGTIQGRVPVTDTPFSWVAYVVPRPYSDAEGRKSVQRLLLMSAAPLRIIGTCPSCTVIMYDTSEGMRHAPAVTNLLGLAPIVGPATCIELARDLKARQVYLATSLRD